MPLNKCKASGRISTHISEPYSLQPYTRLYGWFALRLPNIVACWFFPHLCSTMPFSSHKLHLLFGRKSEFNGVLLRLTLLLVSTESQ
jgi:hypothetical protein